MLGLIKFNSDYEKLLESIAKRLIELNGFPKFSDASYKYEFFKEGKNITPYQFRSFIHGNEDSPRKINSIVYIGISNLAYKNYDQKIYDESIVEGELINNVVKELLRGNDRLSINYENDITQIIIPEGEEKVATMLTELVYDAINLLNRKCRKHLNELSADKKIYCYDVNVGLKRESFAEHLINGADANLNLIYNHSPKLKEAALKAMKDI